MSIILDGTAGIQNNATDLSYTGTLTGNGGIVNIGSGQVYKDASGNVGIGTSSPAQKLHVIQTTDANTDGIRVARAGIAAQYGSFSNYGGATWLTAIDTAAGGNNILVFNRSNNGSTFTESARIDSSGNLLVGTTANIGNNGRLNVKQSIGASCANFQNGSDAGWGISFYNVAGVSAGSISWTATTTTYTTSSDYRLKEDIAPMTGALAKVALLKPCTYKWKVDGSDGQGFIAHELAEVEAGCVTGEKDAVDAEGKPQYQGIDTSFLVATLTAAIQELKTLVDTQAARITALEGAAA